MMGVNLKMEPRDYYWKTMADVARCSNLCSMKVSFYSAFTTWTSAGTAVIATGSLGIVLYTHNTCLLLLTVISQVYQAAMPYLPYIKNTPTLRLAAARLESILTDMVAGWRTIDQMTDDEILQHVKNYDESYSKIMNDILHDGITFSEKAQDEAEDKRDVFLQQFIS